MLWFDRREVGLPHGRPGCSPCWEEGKQERKERKREEGTEKKDYIGHQQMC